ncbi:MAG: ligand-binding sensor domain-containing protein [Enterobacterales bacterium]|jgi:ligand-binding sensor domain-containing protein
MAINFSRILIVLYLLYVPFSILANGLENTNFKHISTEHGLSQKTVQTIFQDKTGFLWFGTQEGLNRYDGRELKIFRHDDNDPFSLSNDVIRDLLEDKQGNLWVATSAGLNRYNAENENFERLIIKNEQGEVVSRLNSIFVDSSEQLWVGTEEFGVFIINQENYQVSRNEHLALLNNSDVRAIFEDSRNRMWIGTDGKGALLITRNDKAIFHFLQQENTQGTISHNRIRSIIEDSNGRIWLATRGGGINRFDELSKTFTHYMNDPTDNKSLSHNRVYQIFEDSQKKLWMATAEGVSIYQPASNNFLNIKQKPSQPYGLSSDRVLAIFQDNAGLIWLGTNSGLNQWNPVNAVFAHYRQISEDPITLSDDMVYGFAETNSGAFYVGTFGGGLNSFDPETNKIGLVKNSDGSGKTAKFITSLLMDNQQQLWVGSIPEGVKVYSEDLQELAHYQHSEQNENSLSANGITDIIQDSDGEIWISAFGAGINRLDKITTQFKRYGADNKNTSLVNDTKENVSQNSNYIVSDFLVSNNAFMLMEDDEGYIWVATDGGGISRLDKNTHKFINFTHQEDNSESLSSDSAWSIFQDSKGRFWIGTQGNGLNRWEPEDRRQGINRFQHYTVQNGLNSSTVNGVLEDDDGFIWISTSRGVSRLDPETNNIKHFNLADEIHFNELNQGVMLKLNNGQMLFGGEKGVSAFFPQQIISNTNVPKVVITNVFNGNERLLFKQPLSELQEITFDHNDYLVSFDFAALDYTQPRKNNYQYKLEGLDKNWIQLGHLNRATFTNLPSGNYLLKVRGSNNDGVWSDDSVNLKVKVLPAPWATWWAFALYGLLFSILLLMVIRLQAKRMTEQEYFQNRINIKVEEQSEVYVQSNELLKQNFIQLEKSTNLDFATGLPKQKYLCDLLQLTSSWLNQYSVKPAELEGQLSLMLLKVPFAEFDKAKSKKQFEVFAKNVPSILPKDAVVVLWNEDQLGIVNFVASNQEVIAQINSIRDLFTETLSSTNNHFTEEITFAYSLSPFSGVAQSMIDADNLLMLTEHALFSLVKSEGLTVIGIVSALQLLTVPIIKQTLSRDNLLDMHSVFEFYTE